MFEASAMFMLVMGKGHFHPDVSFQRWKIFEKLISEAHHIIIEELDIYMPKKILCIITDLQPRPV